MSVQIAMKASAVSVYPALAVLAVTMFVTGTLPAETGTVGIPEDWSHHHLVFSNPGTYQRAAQDGTVNKWLKITSDPRYILQQRKRSGAASRASAEEPAQERKTKRVLKRDWSQGFGGAGVAPDIYPAKWQFLNGVGTPSCSDYVVFGVNKPGVSGSQANIVGLSNLYNGTCTPTAPTVLFSYYVGTGTVQTSPILGPNANQVAYVESIPSGSKFHVLTGAGTGSSNGTIVAPVARAQETPRLMPA